MSATFPFSSPKGYTATATFSASLPTVALGDPGKVTVGPINDAQVVITNTTAGGRPVQAGTVDPTRFLMVWRVPAELARFSKVSKDDCPNCDQRQTFLVVPVDAAIGFPDGHETITTETTGKVFASPAFWGGTFGSNSLGGASKGVSIPENRQELLAALIAPRPDLVVWNRGGFGFAGGLAKAGCLVHQEQGLFGTGGDYIVMGVANGDGHLLTFREAHDTPGNGCYHKDSTANLD